jgi:hypothetical protein
MSEIMAKVKSISSLRFVHKIKSTKRNRQLHRRILRAYGFKDTEYPEN